jgi:hypothetical protein
MGIKGYTPWLGVRAFRDTNLQAPASSLGQLGIQYDLPSGPRLPDADVAHVENMRRRRLGFYPAGRVLTPGVNSTPGEIASPR